MNISAGVLAGGKSSRFGDDKALAIYKNTTFLEHIVEKCRENFYKVYVSVGDKNKYKQFPFEFVEDEIKGYGPLGGIYALLKKCETDYIFIMPTDMPLIDINIFSALKEKCNSDEYDCIVIKYKGKPEPLCSIYSKKCIPVIEELIKENIGKPRLIFEKVNTCYLNLEDINCDSKAINNINTKEEFNKIIE
ncbi:molybdopterin-guanine dinucleotide biosynthesis protein A [Acetitomaculum ruminis DSM 5522]|uniref:Probable molybdenum cofactor guanylyltransferase n=1 Tax=Acetitomaculum ruminis DSM 5522 TaxID=1120918 RepID=A0A1I0UYE5_9FIRM|nr:molybdenum cofactor guanylyltransferase [Acetitomaculum ruminis]SFA69068.1 molybdopterin-guanine dinucleotide biosynthesis protein A [Acetitomaculum ruminis DSM 5522]